jgi:hypothetical protein
MCHVPVMRRAPGPSRIPKGGRNHGQPRHSAHPPASTVTCLQAWVNACGQAGGRHQGAFNTSPRSRRAAALCLAFRATTNSHYLNEHMPVWRRHRALSVDVSAIIFATIAQLRWQASAVDKVTMRELPLRVRRFSSFVITTPTSHTHFYSLPTLRHVGNWQCHNTI